MRSTTLFTELRPPYTTQLDMASEVAETSVKSGLSLIIKSVYELLKQFRDHEGGRQVFATCEATTSIPL